nr:LysR family transcriptional regulator [Atopomonas sediminilitoris]
MDQWRTLQAVIDHGGYAQAAHALHRSQSSVSYTLARMQEQLGVPLLNIEGRKAVLTEAGKTLLLRSRNLLLQASQLEELAAHMDDGWEPEIRLVVDAAYPTERLASALLAFQPLSRGTRVQLHEEVLSGVEEALKNDQADLAISGLLIAGHLGDDLDGEIFHAVTHPEHPLQTLGRHITAQDLTNHLQVVIRDSGRSQPRDVGWLGAAQRWTVTSLSTAATLVKQGLGFAWLPQHLIQQELKNQQLVPLALENGSVRNVRFYLYPNRSLGPAARVLAQLLRPTQPDNAHKE